MTYTPEQLLNIAFDAEHIGKHSNGIAAYKSHWLSEIFRAHAAALEELARVKAELLGVKEYRERNPLGGPAKVFDAMADQIRAGDDFNKVIADYGWCQVARAERAESALAECRARLEIDFATDGNGKRVPLPAGAPDGIACRDETIRLLEAALAECKERLAIEEANGKHWSDAYSEWVKTDKAARRLIELGDRLAESARKCERLKFHAEAMAKGMLDDGPANLWAAYDAYRAEFKEE